MQREASINKEDFQASTGYPSPNPVPLSPPWKRGLPEYDYSSVLWCPDSVRCDTDSIPSVALSRRLLNEPPARNLIQCAQCLPDAQPQDSSVLNKKTVIAGI